MSATPLISVCILSGRREAQLSACLGSLLAQQSPPDFELVVASDGAAGVASAVAERFPDAVVGTVEGANLGEARNLIVARARGRWLLFLDDDVVLAPDALRTLAEAARLRPDAAVLGGPNLTPPSSPRLERLQGAVLASLVGSGPVRRRYGRYPAGPADERSFTLCNLAVRRDAMPEFAAELVGGEENAILDEIRRAGLEMRYDPALSVYHRRRATVRDFARQMVKYGRGRGQLARRAPRTLRPSYLAPTALVTYLALTPVLVLLTPLALAPLAAYALVVGVGAFAVARASGDLGTAPLAAILIVAVHVGYGAGVARGLLRRRRHRARAPARWVESGAEPGSSTAGSPALELARQEPGT